MPVPTRSRKRKADPAPKHGPVAKRLAKAALATVGTAKAPPSHVDEEESSKLASHTRDNPRVICGTSGYSYAHWTGTYYPRGTRSSQQWDRYSSDFDAVELNAPFYKWHAAETWRSWRDRADRRGDGRPPFLYAVKAHQYFTHWKRLTVDETFVAKFEAFVASCLLLGSHWGPLLLQFPPRFAQNATTLSRLDDFGRLAERVNRKLAADEEAPLHVALEFRHHSWFENMDETMRLAKKHDLGICLVHLINERPSGWADGMNSGYSPRLEEYPATGCSWGVYARFHGSRGQYEGSYDGEFLDRFLHQFKDVGSLYLFFNNTDSGDPPSAIRDAHYVCNRPCKPPLPVA